MVSFLRSILKALNSPYIVSYTQNLFGIKLVKIQDEETTADNSPTKHGHHKMRMLNNKQCLYTRNEFFYYFFMLVTTLGNEIFYILFLPVLMWNLDDKITYFTTISWAFSMYLGQACKDLIKIPRPATPPVVKLEYRFLQEYGFPSTHAMAAVSIAFTLITLLFEQFPAEADSTFRMSALVLGVVLSCSVCLSRVYLGMHSVLDVLVGGVFALVLSVIFLCYSDVYFAFVTANFFNGCLVAALYYTVGLLYPCNNRSNCTKSTARSDTFLILGVAGGVTLAISLKHSLGLTELGKIDSTITRTNFFNLITVLRFLVGAVCVQGSRFLCKRVLYKLIATLGQLKNTATIKDFIQTNFYYDIFFYFVCYTGVSFTAAFNCFIVFHYLQIY